MTDRVLIPLPDGRWLGLTPEQFAEAEQSGRESGPAPPTDAPVVSHDELLTAEQLEARTNVPASWWEQAARERRVPHARIGRYVRFRFAEVAEHFSHNADTAAAVRQWRQCKA
jgi:hypothetical protein